MNNVSLADLRQAWQTYALRLLMTIPEDGIASLDGREKTQRHGAGAITWIITTLIGVLALASITNLAGRASVHKAGISSVVVGIGLALLVPVGVHVAVKVEGNAQKAFVWFMSIVFALISAAIQYQVYAPDGLFLLDKDHLEALAFGAGVPLAECLLAGILAVVIRQATQKEQEQKEQKIQAEQAEIEVQRQAEIEVQRLEDERQERLAEAEHKRQLALIDAEAKADAKRIKAEKREVSAGVNVPVNQVSDKLSIDERRNLILMTVQSRGKVSIAELMTLTGVSKNTVKNDVRQIEGVELTGDGYASDSDLKKMQTDGIINLNGKVETI